MYRNSSWKSKRTILALEEWYCNDSLWRHLEMVMFSFCFPSFLYPLSPISFEGIPKHPQMQTVTAFWVASMFWKARKNMVSFARSIAKWRDNYSSFCLFWWETCEAMNEGGHWWTSTLKEILSVSKCSLYPNLPDPVISVSTLPEKTPSEDFTGVRRGALESR